MNRAFLAGRLGKDPEVRYTSSGQKVTTLILAVNQRRGGKEDTMWWRVSVWGDRFDKMISFLKKGSAMIAIGEMSKPNIYTDRDGNPQVSLDLIASDLSFSPFGKTGEGEGESGLSSPKHPSREKGHRHEEKRSFGETSGQSQEDPSASSETDFSFSEEEIPF